VGSLASTASQKQEGTDMNIQIRDLDRGPLEDARGYYERFLREMAVNALPGDSTSAAVIGAEIDELHAMILMLRTALHN
jgi:hypothetical protein